MNNSIKIICEIFTKKYWRNISNYCNGKNHPISIDYRIYRKGNNRCLKCGAKIGKIKCVRKSSQEQLIDNIFEPSPLLEIFNRIGKHHE